MPIEVNVTDEPIEASVSGDGVSVSVGQTTVDANVTSGIGPVGPTGPQGQPGTTDYLELDNVPSEFNPSAHAATHGVDGSDAVSLAISQVGGLADALAAKLPLAGGSMANAATVTFSDGTNDSEIGGWGFGVETTGGSDYATVTATGVLVHGATASTVITPASVAFGNGTSVVVGSFDNGTSGSNGIALICAVGYELNWQGGRLRNVAVGGDGTALPLVLDSALVLPAAGVTFNDATVQTTAWTGTIEASQATVPSNQDWLYVEDGDNVMGALASIDAALDGKQAAGSYAAASHTHDDRYYTETETDTLLSGKQAAGDYATLVGGVIPSAILPSYVDDVVETASTPTGTGEAGKIYVALDSGKIYRWSGSAYVEISPSPGSTDSVTEGSVNLYFTNARASAAAPVQSVAGKTGTVSLAKGDVGLGNVDNTADASKPVSTAQAAADSAVASAAASDATIKANAAQAHAVQRANHTGTQGANTITGLATVATSGAYSDLSGTPAAYSLPVATSSTLGGVKQGSNVTIDGTGVISVAAPVTSLAWTAITGKPTFATIATTGAYADLSGTPSTFAPSAHKSSHATGGSDALSASDIGAASSSHSHGNITNAGAIGSTSGQVVVTTASGVLTTAATISAATQVSGLAASATTDATNAGNISAGTLNVARLPVTLEQSVAVGNSGASKTLSLSSGSVQTVTLSASCTFTMPSAAAAATLTLILTQGSNYTAAFTGVKWPGGTAPTITATANAIDILTFVSDGTSWYGVAVQKMS